MAERIEWRRADYDAAFEALAARRRGAAPDVSEAVRSIVADVRERGGAALLDATRRFDDLDLADPAALEVSREEIEDAFESLDRGALEALRFAAARIEAFHSAQRPAEIDLTDAAGVRMGLRWRPVGRAGVYVPGGLAAYPSSVLMNAIPARCAKVGEIVMCAPAPGGALSPAVLAAARIAGVDRVFRLGGAQAIAAMAHGAGPVPRCDVVVGPGNAYVAEAKRQIFGAAGIDMLAGPSEIVVYAEAPSPAAWIAADLLSQAEHDPSAQAILLTPDRALADAVEREASAQLATLPKAEIAAASWRDHGAIVIVRDRDDAIAKIDRLAPEHLELMVEDARAMAENVENAGAIFLGAHTPEAIGDYVGGPNHVLPTDRSARFASGLAVWDFMKRTTVLEAGEGGFAQIAWAAERLAKEEGLEGHARACALRREPLT